MRKDEMRLTHVPTSHSRLGHADLQREKVVLMAIQRARTQAQRKISGDKLFLLLLHHGTV